MRKGEDTIESFVKAEFKDSLIKLLNVKMKAEEANIKKGIDEIGRILGTSSYSKSQKEQAVESLKRSIRRYEDRKSYFVKKIRLVKNQDYSVFESILKKNSVYDGFEIDSNGYLNLYTKMLKDGARNIGQFRFCLLKSPAVSGLGWRAINLTWRNGCLDHWAINEGRCCTGEWELDFQKCLYEADIPAFFNLMIHYITLSPEEHTYTTKKDWYEHRKKFSKEDSDKLRSMNISNCHNNSSDDDFEEESDDEELLEED